MDFVTLLERERIPAYRLARRTGTPEDAIMDLCAGRILPRDLPEDTLQSIADFIRCGRDELMAVTAPPAEVTEGGYLERSIPPHLTEALEKMKRSWAILDAGGEDMRWGDCWDELASSINAAEVDRVISPTHAWYLRETYLRMIREEIYVEET